MIYCLIISLILSAISAQATIWNHQVNTPCPAALPGDTINFTNVESVPLTITCSGTAGNPIVFNFLPGSGFSTSNFPTTGAMQLNGHSYLTIDGLGNGFIRNTNNGSLFTTRLNSCGIQGNGYFITIQNLTVTNIYQKIPQTLLPLFTNLPCTSASNTINAPNGNAAFPDIYFQVEFYGTPPSTSGIKANTWYWCINCSGNNFQITTNYNDAGNPITIPDGSYAINVQGYDYYNVGYPIELSGSSITVSNCTIGDGDGVLYYTASDATQSNIFFLNNNIQRGNHTIVMGGQASNCLATNVIIAGNFLDHWDQWDLRGNSQTHLDGIFVNNNTYDPSSAFWNFQIYNNNFGGHTGYRATAGIFIDLVNAQSQMYDLAIYNNTLLSFNAGYGWLGNGYISASGSNVWLVNNTCIGTNGGGAIQANGLNVHILNNINTSGSGETLGSSTTDTSYSGAHGAVNDLFILTNYLYSVWADYNALQASGSYGLTLGNCTNGSWNVWALNAAFGSLYLWQTFQNDEYGWSHPDWNDTHADPHSVVGTPAFVANTWQPTSSDTIARNNGTNLTIVAVQFGWGALTNDATGTNARPTTGAWTIGALVAASGGPVAPTFTTQPSSQVGVTNTTLTLAWSVFGDSSTPYFEVISTNNGTVLSPYSTAAYWASNSLVAWSNWIYVLCTNDAGIIVTSAPVLIQWTNGVGIKALPSFTTLPVSQVAKTNSTLFFMWGLTNNGDPSGIFSQFQSTNNGAPASPWSPNVYFGTNSPTAKSGWYYLVSTNDFGSITSPPVFMQWTNGLFFTPTFAIQPKNNVGLTNTPLTYSWSTISDGSSIAYEIILTNGTVVSTWGVGTSWTITSATPISGAFWVVLTNDTAVISTSSPASYQITNGISGGGGSTASGLVLPFHF